MAYKTNKKIRDRALERYYMNREKILKQQAERWKRKYKEDVEFRKKRQLRDKGRKGKKIEGKCVWCKSTYDLHRHHPTYSDLQYIIICRPCHNKLHAMLKEIHEFIIAPRSVR